MIEKIDLYKNIIDNLEFEPGLDESSISITVKDNAVVVLGGEVSSYAEKCLAEKAIQKVKGVKGIVDELKVNLATPFTRSNLNIANSAIDALKWNFFVPEEQIKLIVENGALILSGEVDEYYQKEHAEKAVENAAHPVNIRLASGEEIIKDVYIVKELSKGLVIRQFNDGEENDTFRFINWTYIKSVTYKRVEKLLSPT